MTLNQSGRPLLIVLFEHLVPGRCGSVEALNTAWSNNIPQGRRRRHAPLRPPKPRHRLAVRIPNPTMSPIANRTGVLPRQASAIRGQNKEAIVMRKIYVSDSGNDKDDWPQRKDTNPLVAALHPAL